MHQFRRLQRIKMRTIRQGSILLMIEATNHFAILRALLIGKAPAY